MVPHVIRLYSGVGEFREYFGLFVQISAATSLRVKQEIHNALSLIGMWLPVCPESRQIRAADVNGFY